MCAIMNGSASKPKWSRMRISATKPVWVYHRLSPSAVYATVRIEADGGWSWYATRRQQGEALTQNAAQVAAIMAVMSGEHEHVSAETLSDELVRLNGRAFSSGAGSY